MYSFDQLIDTVQNLNSSVLNTFVLEKKVRTPIQQLLDAQAAFAKQIVKSSTDLYAVSSDEALTYSSKKMKEFFSKS